MSYLSGDPLIKNHPMKGNTRVSRRYGARGDAVAAICDEAIDAVGPKATWTRLVSEVGLRLMAEGLERPSDRSLRARIAHRLCLAIGEPGDGARLVVDVTRLHVPAVSDGVARDPILVLAIVDPLRLIAGHLLDPNGTDPAPILAARLLAGLTGEGYRPPITIRLPNAPPRAWMELRALLVDAEARVTSPTVASHRLGAEIDLLIGRDLGGLRIGGPRRRASIERDHAVSLPDLLGLVDVAVRRHNRTLGHRLPAFGLTRHLDDEMRQRLAAFSRSRPSRPGRHGTSQDDRSTGRWKASRIMPGFGDVDDGPGADRPDEPAVPGGPGNSLVSPE